MLQLPRDVTRVVDEHDVSMARTRYSMNGGLDSPAYPPRRRLGASTDEDSEEEIDGLRSALLVTLLPPPTVNDYHLKSDTRRDVISRCQKRFHSHRLDRDSKSMNSEARYISPSRDLLPPHSSQSLVVRAPPQNTAKSSRRGSIVPRKKGTSQDLSQKSTRTRDMTRQ